MKLAAIISAYLALAIVSGWVVSTYADEAPPASSELVELVPGL